MRLRRICEPESPLAICSASSAGSSTSMKASRSSMRPILAFSTLSSFVSTATRSATVALSFLPMPTNTFAVAGASGTGVATAAAVAAAVEAAIASVQSR